MRPTTSLLGYASYLGYAYCGPCGVAYEDEDRKLVLYSAELYDTCELCGHRVVTKPAMESFAGSDVVEHTVCRIF